ncbi:MAG TPA: chemotaxis protein CheA [Thermoanaerobaculia bacterium]|nr:chemotaxis protein CheA [Thermoanaerobaculia bacterium]
MSPPPGDGSPSDAPDPLDADFASLVPLFVAESQERLARMELALLTLEKEPANRDALDEVFRGAHTIKGDAATLGMRDLADFAHRLEDTLDSLRDGTSEMSASLATALLRTVDLLRELVAEAEGGEERSREDLERALASVTEELQEAAPGPQAQTSSAALSELEQVSSSLRVDVGRLDELLTLAGELVAARSQLIAALESDEPRSELLDLTRSSERHYLDLQDLVMKLRMVAVGPTFRRLQRMVRDQSLGLGKKATLELEGTDVELDNSVLQRLRDPLSHLLRNALAHGIEAPDERLEANKEETGRIVLRSRRDGGAITIEVADDGRGLDRDAIVERARALGLIGSDQEVGHRDALDLVFLPGLSTARQVSEAAGRGVGLDVVKREVEALRGTVQVSSSLGEGTTVSISLPLTLAVIEALHVLIEGRLFVIALDTVLEVLELPDHSLAAGQRFGIIELRNHIVNCVRLDTLLGLDAARTNGAPEHQRVVVLRLPVGEVGVVVDEVLGKSQTLIRPLPKIVRRTPGFSGLAALSDGRLSLILDVPDLLHHHGLTASFPEGPAPLAAGGAR